MNKKKILILLGSAFIITILLLVVFYLIGTRPNRENTSNDFYLNFNQDEYPVVVEALNKSFNESSFELNRDDFLYADLAFGEKKLNSTPYLIDLYSNGAKDNQTILLEVSEDNEIIYLAKVPNDPRKKLGNILTKGGQLINVSDIDMIDFFNKYRDDFEIMANLEDKKISNNFNKDLVNIYFVDTNMFIVMEAWADNEVGFLYAPEEVPEYINGIQFIREIEDHWYIFRKS